MPDTPPSVRAKPFASILMPVYNGMPLLAEALESLRRQTPADITFEVIAADDGSTDGSRELLEVESRKGAIPLRVIDGARRGNWVASTNKLIDCAIGEFIGFLHQDDMYAPGRLARLHQAASRFHDVAFIANATVFVGADGRRLGHWRAPLKEGMLAPSECLPQLLVQNNFSVPSVFIRRSAAIEAGPMDESLKYTADWDYWLRIMSRHGVCYLREELSCFRVHGASQTVSIASRGDEMRYNLEEVARRFLPRVKAISTSARYNRACRLASLGIETNLLFASMAVGIGRPWRQFFRALVPCIPLDVLRFLSSSKITARITARIRAGFTAKKGMVRK